MGWRFKTFEIRSPQLNLGKPIRPGDQIKGDLFLVITEPIRMQRLSLNICGQSKTTVPKYVGEHFNQATARYEDQFLPVQDQEIYFHASFDFKYNNRFRNQVIPTGEHSIPFRFRFPSHHRQQIVVSTTGDSDGTTNSNNDISNSDLIMRKASRSMIQLLDLPSSVSIDPFNGISYTMQSVLVWQEQPLLAEGAMIPEELSGSTNSMKESRKLTQIVEIPFVGQADLLLITAAASNLLDPYTFSETKQVTSCCRSAGLVTVKFTLPKRAFTLDESIPFTLIINNQSSKNINELSISLVEVAYKYCRDSTDDHQTSSSLSDASEQAVVVLESGYSLDDGMHDNGMEFPHVEPLPICKRRSRLQVKDRLILLKWSTPFLQGTDLIRIEHYIRLFVADVCRNSIRIYIGSDQPTETTDQLSNGVAAPTHCRRNTVIWSDSILANSRKRSSVQSIQSLAKHEKLVGPSCFVESPEPTYNEAKRFDASSESNSPSSASSLGPWSETIHFV